MTDQGPNLAILKKRLGIRISEIQIQLDRLDLRKLELNEELNRINDTIKSLNNEMVDAKKQLDSTK
jgi:hypothetical protein